METLSDLQSTWVNLLVAVIVLFALYFVLQFLSGFLNKTNFQGRMYGNVANGLRYILLIYEPMVLLILGSIFVLINPVLHGLVMGLIFIVSFAGIKNYASGRIIQFETSLAVGSRLSIQNLQGIISKTGRLGLHLKTNKGLQFIPYTQMYANGFMILSGEEIGGFYELRIAPQQIDDKIDYRIQLTDLLASAPYLDRHHKPVILPLVESPQQFDAKILVREENHLYDLISLMREWGYSCKLSKK